MKVLVFGANGQVGDALSKTLPKDIEAEFVDRSACDLSYPDQIETMLDRHNPDVVINAAAYTAVDKAESEPELAHQINTLAPEAMAHWTSSRPKRRDLKPATLIHISTDFVFSGEADQPYGTSDEPRPIGVYGNSKLKGERAALDQAPESTIIIRTSWVYSEHGGNFVKTMIRLMSERDELGVVNDQFGSPTYAKSLARMLWMMVGSETPPGTYHWSDAGTITWFDFASAIYEEATRAGLLNSEVTIQPIETHEYPTPAKRPRYSSLNVSKIEKQLGIRATPWRDNLVEMISRLGS